MEGCAASKIAAMAASLRRRSSGVSSPRSVRSSAITPVLRVRAASEANRRPRTSPRRPRQPQARTMRFAGRMSYRQPPDELGPHVVIAWLLALGALAQCTEHRVGVEDDHALAY